MPQSSPAQRQPDSSQARTPLAAAKCIVGCGRRIQGRACAPGNLAVIHKREIQRVVDVTKTTGAAALLRARIIQPLYGTTHMGEWNDGAVHQVPVAS